jgi:hypothetical protein
LLARDQKLIAVPKAIIGASDPELAVYLLRLLHQALDFKAVREIFCFYFLWVVWIIWLFCCLVYWLFGCLVVGGQ